MEVACDSTLLSAAQSDELQVSVMEGPSKDVCLANSPGVNMETEVTPEKDCIVFTFSFEAASESVPTVEHPSKGVQSSIVNSETEVTPTRDFDESTSVSEVVMSESVSMIESEGMSNAKDASVNTALAEDLDDPMSPADKPVSKIDGLRNPSSSVNPQTEATSDEQCTSSTSNQTQPSSVNKANGIIVDIPLSTIQELAAKVPLTYDDDDGDDDGDGDDDDDGDDGGDDDDDGDGDDDVDDDAAADDDDNIPLSTKKELAAKIPLTFDDDDDDIPLSTIKELAANIPLTSVRKRNVSTTLEQPPSSEGENKITDNQEITTDALFVAALNRKKKSSLSSQDLRQSPSKKIKLDTDIKVVVTDIMSTSGVHVRSCMSPLHRVFKEMCRCTSSTSCDKKVAVFQRMLQIFVNRNHHVLLLVDHIDGNSILHTCAVEIRELSKQIKSAESLDEPLAELQRLLQWRTLLDKLFREMVQIFQSLSSEGPFLQEQVIKLFSCKNKAGETIGKILKEDDLLRKSCSDEAYQVTLSVPEQEGMSFDYGKQQHSLDNGHCDIKMVTKDASSQSTQAEDFSGTVATDQSTDEPPEQSPSTSASSSALASTETGPASQTVNHSAMTALPHNCPSVHSTGEHLEQSLSSPASAAALASTHADPASQTVNPSATTTLPHNNSSVHSTGQHLEKSLSSAASAAALASTQADSASQTVNHSATTALPHNCLSVHLTGQHLEQSLSAAASSSALALTRTGPASQTVNHSATMALPHNCPSVHSTGEHLEQSLSTAASAAALASTHAEPASQTVNHSATTALPHNSMSVHSTDEHLKQSLSSSASATGLVSTQADPASQTVNHSATMAVPHNSMSVHSTDEHLEQSLSSDASVAALASTQTKLASQTVNHSATTALPHNRPSVHSTGEHLEQSLSTDASVAALVSTQAKPASQTVNHSATTTLPHNSMSVQSTDGHLKQSLSTDASAAALASTCADPASQTVNHSATTALPHNCPSVRSTGEHLEQSLSTDASSSALASTETGPASQTVNHLPTTALPHNCTSVPSTDARPEQSLSVAVSTTAAASLCLPSTSQTVTMATMSFLPVHLPKGCARESIKTSVFSTCSSQTSLSSQEANKSGTTGTSSNDPAVQSSSDTGKPGSDLSTIKDKKALRRSTSSNDPPVQLPSDIGKPGKDLLTIKNKKASCRRTHTFLCVPLCSVKHHTLIQLLIATPDHHSRDTRTTEIESCKRFRDYLTETSWSINSVVPDPKPSLRFSIVHLACLLGKYKALEVLSEFGFLPLSTAAFTEETPLHMLVKLLRHESSGSVFLCEVVVSILNTLSQRMHAMFLLSAKDVNGDTVLHLMAKTIGSANVKAEVAVFFIYLFRVFVHFQLKGHMVSVQHWSLLNSLTDCNNTGQNVELLLDTNGYGKQLLTYLRNILAKTKPSETSNGQSARTETPSGQKDTRQVLFALLRPLQNYISSARIDNCESTSPHPESRATTNVRIKQEPGEPVAQEDTQQASEAEPESLVDFVLSDECGINDFTKQQIVKFYLTEYDKRLKFLAAKMTRLKSNSETTMKDAVKTLEKELPLVKLSIEQNTRLMREAIDERNKYRREHSRLDIKIWRIEQLAEALQQME